MTGGAPLAGLAALAAARHDDPAIVLDGGEVLTYGGWERRSEALARGLAARGVVPGQRVALRFDAAGWTSFAVAHAGVVRAGAIAVLIPAGLADGDAARAVRSSGAAAVLCGPGLEPQGASAWAAAPEDIEEEGRQPGAARPVLEPSAAAEHRSSAEPARVGSSPGPASELLLDTGPLTRPQQLARGPEALAPPVELLRPGWLVHTFAPGSTAGQHVLARALAGTEGGVAGLTRFSAPALLALAARLEATTCGLTAGLAAALVAGVDAGSAPASLTALVLSSPVGTGLAADLAALFPAADVLRLDVADARTGEGAGAGAAGETAPVAASQLGMVWHEQLAPGSFNLPSLVRRYRGTLDVAALERALAELIRRHVPLRTTFTMARGRPEQVVRPAGGFTLDVVDLSTLEPVEREQAAAGLVAEATTEAFDLVEGPLFAPRLLPLGPDDHVLVVRLHHTAFDDWSVDVFRRELSALYTAFSTGQRSPLPDVPTRFVDVCRIQHARIEAEAGDEQRRYWREHMSGAPLAAQLALGERHQLGPERPGAGEPVRHDIPADLARRVRALAPRLRATPFMTVLAAFEVLLARRTRTDDLVLSTVVAGRGPTAVEPLIGCFTRKVILRVRLDGDPGFADIVARTRTAVLGALAHQDLPFEAVVQDTIGDAAAAHGLAAQVPIVFQGETPQDARLTLPGIEVGPFDVPASARRERHFTTARDEGPAWGDGAYLGSFLLVSLLEQAGGMALVARGVFHRPAAVALLQELEALLEDISAEPDQRLSRLLRSGVEADVTAGPDDLSLLGLRVSRARLESALGSCPGVADVALSVTGDGDPRLVAYVVPAEGVAAPTMAQLRHALWAVLPGSPWPAEAVIVDELPRRPDGHADATALPPGRPVDRTPDPDAALLTALWSQAAGRDISPATSYWQDFTFLPALAAARAAGLQIPDQLVARCRTPEMLAAALPRPANPSRVPTSAVSRNQKWALPEG